MRAQRITALSNETLAAAEVPPISMLQATSARVFHSQRKATIGSTRVARRAGR